MRPPSTLSTMPTCAPSAPMTSICSFTFDRSAILFSPLAPAERAAGKRGALRSALHDGEARSDEFAAQPQAGRIDAVPKAFGNMRFRLDPDPVEIPLRGVQG